MGVACEGCATTQSSGVMVGPPSLCVAKTGLLATLVSEKVTVLEGVIVLYLSVSKSVYLPLLAKANLFPSALQQLLTRPSITHLPRGSCLVQLALGGDKALNKTSGASSSINST